MDDLICRIVAAAVCACFYLAATAKLLGAMQQSGYQGGKFLRWFFKKENTYFARLLFWSVLSVVAATLVCVTFSFLEGNGAIVASALPFFFFCFLFCLADRKYALKVKTVPSGRVKRLGVAYVFLCACIAFIVISACSLLGVALAGQVEWVRSLRYLPVCFFPLLLPFILCLANAIMSIFEVARNKKFVKRAGQVLDETNILRVGIVGSYGKTSVKNILKTLLAEGAEGGKIVATPASYNTPIGVAKTVMSEEFQGASVFLCEMGARKAGDIRELCELVKPDYIVFTGVCAQHIQTFGSEENVLRAKCEALASTAKRVICAKSLKEKIEGLGISVELFEKCVFVEDAQAVELSATQTSFTLTVGGEPTRVSTPLLGEAAVENIAIAVRLCEELGVSREAIEAGLAQVQPTEHRLQLIEANGAYILDDAYNCNVRGARIAIDALKRFSGKKFVVTPGIVETGVLEAKINGELGELLADEAIDRVILVGETQVKAVKDGYVAAGGDAEKLTVVNHLQKAQELLAEELRQGDCVLFLNDLPDVV